jgi:hypothetical protein
MFVYIVTDMQDHFAEVFSSNKRAEEWIWKQNELLQPGKRRRYKIAYTLVK